jgi:hypothetical protein
VAIKIAPARVAAPTRAAEAEVAHVRRDVAVKVALVGEPAAATDEGAGERLLLGVRAHVAHERAALDKRLVTERHWASVALVPVVATQMTPETVTRGEGRQTLISWAGVTLRWLRSVRGLPDSVLLRRVLAGDEGDRLDGSSLQQPFVSMGQGADIKLPRRDGERECAKLGQMAPRGTQMARRGAQALVSLPQSHS